MTKTEEKTRDQDRDHTKEAKKEEDAEPSRTSLPASVPVPTISSIHIAKDLMNEAVLELRMSWSGKMFELKVPEQDRIWDLKNLIWSLTEVPLERIKLIGLTTTKAGTGLEDSVVIKSLGLKSGKKFMMLGTSVENSFKDPTRLQQKEIIDDFDIDYSSAQIPPHEDPRNQRKIKETFEKLQINIINPPRPGKKLLVLDLDYTLVDTKPLISGSLPPLECARPNLHSFLQRVYQAYDLVIWSQTSWRWLESKLTELGMLGDEAERMGFRICCTLDRGSMFTVFGEKDGKEYKHEVKPLELLYLQFPEFSPANTIHIDDLSRNFACNPREGLKIKAYKSAEAVAAEAAGGSNTSTGEEHGEPRRKRDKELDRLGGYLMALSRSDNFRRDVDHNRDWPAYRRLDKQKQLPPDGNFR